MTTIPGHGEKQKRTTAITLPLFDVEEDCLERRHNPPSTIKATSIMTMPGRGRSKKNLRQPNVSFQLDDNTFFEDTVDFQYGESDTDNEPSTSSFSRRNEDIPEDSMQFSHQSCIRTSYVDPPLGRDSYAMESDRVEEFLRSLKEEIMSTSRKAQTSKKRFSNDPKSKKRFSMAVRTTDTVLTYPDDCFSFLIANGPIENPWFFWFGMMVSMLQCFFLTLAILSVVHPTWNTVGGTDNPSSHFVPSNVYFIVRAAQILAVISYCLFAETSLKDIITAVELFPQYSKVDKEYDKYGCMVLSCVLRFTIGLMTVATTFLMIIGSTSVIDTILDFLAMTFIADIGKMAFQLALWGKYGKALEKEARRLEDAPMPYCMIRKPSNKRYLSTVLPIVAAILMALVIIVGGQEKYNIWTTKFLRVQFRDSAYLEPYSGCYTVATKAERNRGFFDRKRKRYEGFSENNLDAKFGYCHDEKTWFLFQSEDNNNPCNLTSEEKLAFSLSTENFDIASSFNDPWYDRHGMPIGMYLFNGLTNEDDLNETCNSFLNDGRCDPIFNDFDNDYDGGDCCASTCTKSDCGIGELTSAFGITITDEDLYDQQQHLGDGFPNCVNPTMVPITVFFDNIFDSFTYNQQLHQHQHQQQQQHQVEDRASTSSMTLLDSNSSIIEPIMLLDCDGKNILTVHVNEQMAGQMETVMVEDGAACTIRINNSTSATVANKSHIWYVNYTVYHGDSVSATVKDEDDDNSIVILRDQSVNHEYAKFERIPKCYFEKLSDHLDNTTIYTGTDPQSQAIEWLQVNSRTRSWCEDEFFLERYALTVLNFAAPIQPLHELPTPQVIDPSTEFTTENNDSSTSEWLLSMIQNPMDDLSATDKNLTTTTLILASTPEITLLQAHWMLDEKLWINTNRLCTWWSVECNGGSVESLDLYRFDLHGTIASEIGLLTKLTKLQIVDNYHLIGTIPREIGLLTSLKTLSFAGNSLSGTLPSEIGDLSNLEILDLSNNSFTGSIPAELGRLALMYNLTRVFVGDNEALVLDGIPTELRDVIHTKCVVCNGKDHLIQTIYTETCTYMLEQFTQNQQMMTVGDCETLRLRCSAC